jgi:hypothetical protein
MEQQWRRSGKRKDGLKLETSVVWFFLSQRTSSLILTKLMQLFFGYGFEWV